MRFKLGQGLYENTIWKYFIFRLWPFSLYCKNLSDGIITIWANGGIMHEEFYMSIVEISDIVITTDMNQREKKCCCQDSVLLPRHEAFMVGRWRRTHSSVHFWVFDTNQSQRLLIGFYLDTRFISIFRKSSQETFGFSTQWDKEHVSQLWLSHIHHQNISTEKHFYIQISFVYTSILVHFYFC